MPQPVEEGPDGLVITGNDTRTAADGQVIYISTWRLTPIE